jgi:hypothetical protein
MNHRQGRGRTVIKSWPGPHRLDMPEQLKFASGSAPSQFEQGPCPPNCPLCASGVSHITVRPKQLSPPLPRRKRALRLDQSARLEVKPKVQVLWHDPSGFCKVKFLPWRRPATNESLAEWIQDYFDMIEHGYRPAGFEDPPLPHCARVLYLGKVLAEWYLRPSFSAESLVTADERGGPGGIQAAPPSAPCSECLAVPTQSGPCRNDSAGIDRDPPKSPDSTRAVLTTG